MLLVTSALLGVVILVEDYLLGVEGDRFLWYYNDVGFHAYGLIGFLIVDLILVGTILARGRIGVQLALLWSILQTPVMLLDPFTGSQFGIEPAEFARYLFSIWGFDLLLITRIITIPIAFRTSKALKPE